MNKLVVICFVALVMLGLSFAVSSCQAISTPNTVYTLDQNVNINGANCFSLSASNITLDCAGYSITGDNTLGTVGIDITQNEATITNCELSGFETGIRFTQDIPATMYILNSTVSSSLGKAFEKTHTTNNGLAVYVNYSNFITTAPSSDAFYLEGDWSSIYSNRNSFSAINGNAVTLNFGIQSGYIDNSNFTTTNGNAFYGIDYITLPITNSKFSTGNGAGIYLTNSQILVSVNNCSIFANGTGIYRDSNNGGTNPSLPFEFFGVFSGNTIIVNGTAIKTEEIGDYAGGASWYNNTIYSNIWVNDNYSSTTSSHNLFYNNVTNHGNKYYFSNGTPSWEVFNITTENAPNWATNGSNYPFNSSTVSAWIGDGNDWYPYTSNYTMHNPYCSITANNPFYPEPVIINASCNNGLVTHLYRNGTEIFNNSDLVGAGNYNYSIVSEANQSYYASTTYFSTTVDKGVLTLSLYLNGVQTNTTISNGTEVNVSVVIVYEDDLFLDGVLIPNPSILSNLTPGIHNITATFGNENYSTVSTTLLIEVLNQTLTIQQAVAAPIIETNATTNQVVFGQYSPSTNISISDSSGVMLDFTAIQTTSGNTTNVITPNTIDLGGALSSILVTIPSGANLSGDLWDSSFNATTVPTSSVSISGGTVSEAYDIGAGDTQINSSKAVRIVFKNNNGKHLGWYKNGMLTEITTNCNFDNQFVDSQLGDGEDCKIMVGNDLVIWTKHFTVFAVYSLSSSSSSAPASSSGGSGGGSYNSFVGVIRAGDISTTDTTNENTTITPVVKTPSAYSNPVEKIEILNNLGGKTSEAKVGDTIILKSEDSNGNVVAGAMINIFKPSGTSFSVVTGSDGTTELYIDEEGAYTFSLPSSNIQAAGVLTTKAQTTVQPVKTAPVLPPETITAEMPKANNNLLIPVGIVAAVIIIAVIAIAAIAYIDSERKKKEESKLKAKGAEELPNESEKPLV